MSDAPVPNYGGHHYPGIVDGKFERTSNCSYGCGAWMGGTRSSGGIDSVNPHGDCPKRPAGTEMVLPLPMLLPEEEEATLNLEPIRNFLAACIARSTVLSDATARLIVRDFIEAIRKDERSRAKPPKLPTSLA